MNLRKRTMSAGRWTATSAMGRVGFQLLQVAVVARFIPPEDIGLMAIVVAILAVLQLLADFGLGRATIHYDNIDSDTLSTLYWLNVVLAAAIAFVVCAAAPLIAAFYDKPALTMVLWSTAPSLLLQALGQQFAVLAEKELRLAALAQNEILASAAGFSACGGLAVFAHMGVYALVGGALASAGTLSALAWLRLSRHHRPRLHLRFDEARPFLRYGSYLVGENFAGSIVRQVDVFVGGAAVPTAALGFYSLPRDLSLRLGMTINQIATRIGFPVMASIKHDRARLADVYLQSLRMTAAVNFPLYIFLGVFSDELINLLYGQRFAAAAPLLQLLAAWGLVRSIGNPVGALLYAVGRTRRAFWWNIMQLAVLPIVFWLAARAHGITGLAVAMVAMQLALVVPAWRWLVRPCLDVSLMTYLRPLVAALLAALLAGVAAYFATLHLPHGTLRLATGAVGGGGVYCVLSLWVNRPWWNTIIELITPRFLASRQ
jgi:O-antigen/teichoic acid export membrane protein